MITPEIVINGRFLSRRVTGVERYGRGILSCIRHEYRVEATHVNGLRGHLWEQFILPQTLNPRSVIWSPANTGPVVVHNQVLTIHDLSPLEHPEWFHSSFARWYRLLLPVLLHRVRAIFTPSDFVRKKIKQKFRTNQVIVTPNGVDRATFHPYAKQDRYDLPRSYILFVGTLEPRKNLAGLIQAWNEVKDEFKRTFLVIVGATGTVFGPLKLHGAPERILFLGYVDDEDLPGIYANAQALILPSFDEGFGLPALEAMASGTPVIFSDGGALPEVVGNAGMIFKLSEAGSLATALREILSNQQLHISLKEKGLTRAELFSWQATAERVWNTLYEV
jgi:glycosyltransferase involved in cell wall biosynthesis